MAQGYGEFEIQVVGCYSLHLYCGRANAAHTWGEFPHDYGGPTGSYCRKQARKAGWIIKGQTAVCPKCSGKKPARR